MEYGAIDLHKVHSEVRIVNAEGAPVFEQRIRTTRDEFARVWRDRAPMRILVESSTESEWVARTLEACGHEVIVADPNYLPMYGSRSRRIKTDRRDVAALAEACRTGQYRRAHRVSEASRDLRRTLRVRQHLVRVRSGVICLVRAMLRQEGLRLPSGSADAILARLARVTLPAPLVAILAPLGHHLAELNASLATLTAVVSARAHEHARVTRLMTAPGVGSIVALSFHATLDDPARFGGSAARASAYVGLVPSEDSSAERRLKGHITKTGPRDLRALLVQASWTIWRSKTADAAALRTWAHALAARRGRRIAVVALARRLTRILYARWRDDTAFVARGPATRVAG
jgi:transposase